MASRELKDLQPIVAKKAKELISLALTSGITLIVTSTLRTFQEQTDLFAQGRTAPSNGKIVTWARAGESWHNFGLAFDVVPIVNGKAIWTSITLWNTIGRLGKQIGLIWGGDFPGKKKDRPHLEYHPNLTLVQANQRKQISKPLLQEV